MVKAKYPGAYDDIPDGVLGQKIKAKFPGAYDDFADTSYTPTTQPPPGPTLSENISGGLAEAGGVLAGAGNTLYQAGKAAVGGNFGPLGQVAESAARGVLRPILAANPSLISATLGNETALQQLRDEQQAREGQTPAGQYIQRRNAQLAAAAAQNKSLGGKIARGAARFIGEAAPVVATGLATGGSVPAIATAAGLQSAGTPENIVPMAALTAAPIPVGQAFRAGVNAIRRTFGKGAAQIIEAEALPAATAQVQQTIPEPPVAGEASPTVQNAMQQFEQEVQRIKDLPPAQQAAEMDAAIRRIASETSGIQPVSDSVRRGYPEPMTFPDNPNPIQQAGRLPAPPPGSVDITPTPVDAGPPPLGDLEPPQFGVRGVPEPGYTEATGPSLNEAQGMNASASGPSASAPMDLNATVAQAVASAKTPLAQRAKNEFLGLLGLSKSLRSTADISYPGRQGILLFLRPLQWRQSAKVLKDMFRAFRTKDFEAINQAIESHPLAGRMNDAGLAIDVAEEAFPSQAGSKISQVVQKAPVIKQSEQAYKTAANVQRVEAFQQYANAIDKAGLSPEEALKADKAAAQWINFTTGRGSLGQRADRAFELLNFFYFSPRFIASRLNVLNPAMYIKNAMSPGGRVVLKQQMSDLMQFASVAATTLYLAKQAGADVGLNYHSPDFGKIKFGNYRYDLGAGLTQTLRLIFRVGEDFTRAARGEKPQFGKTAIDIGQTFLSYKLSPPAAVFRNFINQRTPDKKPFTYGGAVADLVAPMQWADFVDAYHKEGWGGVLKTSPGLTGVGVQNYDLGPVQSAVERAQPLLNELQRLNVQVPALRKRGQGDKLEPDDIFNKRVQQFGQNYTLYGLKLLDSPRFQQAPDNVKAEVAKRLGAIAQGLTTKDVAFPELELDPNRLMDSVEGTIQRKQERVRQRGF